MTAPNTLEGGDGNDTLDGAGGDDVINGNGGDDVLIGGKDNDTLNGGAGNDILHGDAGDDVLNGGDDDDTLNGGAGNDILNGNDGNDELNGGADNDTLDGGAGDDKMDGGDGNDVYYIRSKGDVIVEATIGGGIDTAYILTEEAYTLDDEVGVEVLAVGDGFDHDVEITGNKLANTIRGGSGNDSLDGAGGNDSIYGAGGNDTLDGGTGDDTLSGGLGDDTYYARGNETIEDEGGTDTVVVFASGTYTLADFIENGVIDESATGANLTGNGEGNKLTGNDEVNTLTGLGGNDTLDGGEGADVLRGGAGSDTYYVDDVDDDVRDDGTDGTDLVIVTGSGEFTLGVGIENGSLDGSASDAHLTGNSGDNTLWGNSGASTLDGGDGNDTLWGRGGADTLLGGEGNDVLWGEFGNDSLEGGSGNDELHGGLNSDRLYGGSGADTLDGGTENDTLDGGTGADHMTGGDGDDVYYVDDAGDEVSESENGGSDTARLQTGDNLNLDQAISMAGDLKAHGIETVYIDDHLYSAPTDLTFTGGTIGEDAEGGDFVGALRADDSDGEILSFRFLNDEGEESTTDPSGRFVIVFTNGAWRIQVADGATFDHETESSYTVTVRVTDRHGLTHDEEITITIDDVNEAPDTISLNGGTEVEIPENSTLIGTLSATDPEGDEITGYTITGGDLFEMFEVVLNGNVFELRVRAGYQLDYEALDEFRKYLDLTITATAGGQTSEPQTIRINVANLPDGPNGTDDNDTLNGTAGNDTLDGGKGNDILNGLGGNDGLIGGEHNDTLNGGGDNDTLDGGDGDDVLNGGDGDDTYYVRGHETIEDSDGTDTVVVLVPGEYTLDEFIENASVGGSMEGVKLTGNGSANQLFGNAGNDTLIGATGNDSLYGDEGDDSLEGGADDDWLVGGSGADTLDGGSDDDVLIGGSGVDVLYGGGGNDTLNGGFIDGDGKAIGDGEADTLHAGAGDDTYFLMDADDEIDFSAGKDEGFDKAYILSANFLDNEGNVDWDAIQAYAEYLWDNGIDEIYINDDDEPYGGQGGGDPEDNIYHVFPDSLPIVEDLDPEVGGIDTAIIHVASYTLEDTVGVEILEVADGLDFNVEITGNNQDNTIYGSLRDDTLRGGDGNDLISDDKEDGSDDGDGADLLDGGSGEDTLVGGLGNDLLFGGADDDTLIGGNNDDHLRWRRQRRARWRRGQ